MGYRGKLKEREAARVLRAAGHTLLEIADRLGVSKSSVSLWVRDVPFTPRLPFAQLEGLKIAQRLGPNALQQRKAAEIERLRLEAIDSVGRLSERDLFIAGIALYAGEGSKTGGAVKFSNSDPALVAFFFKWLRAFFEPDEQRLRIHLYLHQGLSLDAAVRHWSAVTAIPPAQFSKPYRAVPDGGIRRTKHVHGCATVGYSCTRTLRAILGLIDAVFPDPR